MLHADWGRVWRPPWRSVLQGGGIAAIPDDDPIWQDVSYYNTFDRVEQDVNTEKGEGSFNTIDGGGATNAGDYLAVGLHPKGATALNIGTYKNWTANVDPGQTVLAEEDTVFTIGFRAKVGTTTDGLLFSFGSGDTDGGLSIRRGNSAGRIVVATGRDKSQINYAPSGGSDSTYYTYFVIYNASAEKKLSLYAGAGESPVGTGGVEGTVVAKPFQWGWRYGDASLQWETKGNGAIDVLGVWKRALTQAERQTLTTEWETLASVPPEMAAVSFAEVPEGWGEAPTEAVVLNAASTLELELIDEARQTLGGRAANVAEIVAGSGTPNIYGITGNGQGNRSTLERDVWLKVSGGTYGTIVGGKENNWTSSHANTINGNLLTEVTGSSTRAKNVIGAIAAGGNGSNNGAFPFTGDSLVTIADGAQVSGAVVGGGTSQHRFTVQHNGDATVRIRSVQTSATTGDGIVSRADIVGGALPGASGNVGSGYVVNGDTRVEIEIPEASGSFGKHVLGASRVEDNTTGNYTVNGDSTVVVDAPFSGRKTSSVWIDQAKAQYDVAKKTIEENENCRRVLYIAGKEKSYVTAERIKGMRQLAGEMDLTLRVEYGDFSEKKARELTFLHEKETDVFVCASDLMAIGAMRALMEMDVFHPVCGFDGITLMGYAGKQMNTVRQNFLRVSAAAVEEMARLMAGQPGRNRVLDYELVRMQYQDIIK